MHLEVVILFAPQWVQYCLKAVELIPKIIDSEDSNLFSPFTLYFSCELNMKFEVFLGFIFKLVA